MNYLILFSMGFVAAITPGPDIFYILRQTICNGKRVGFIVTFGILIGNIIYLSLVGLGLGAIGKNLYFQAIVGLIGGIYLLRVAYLIYKDKPHLVKSCEKTKNFSIIKEALFLNLSNPKAMIFFAVVITPFLTDNVFLSLSTLFTGIASAFIVAVIISSKIPISDKILTIINKIASVIFIFFAFVLLKSSYKSIVAILQ